MQDTKNNSILKKSHYPAAEQLVMSRLLETIFKMEDDLDQAIIKFGPDKPFIIQRNAQIEVISDACNRLHEALSREQSLIKECNSLLSEVNTLKTVLHGINKRDAEPMINFINGFVKTRKPGKGGTTYED